ncbi:hypothetical protein [Paraflavitalea speifideaquila]|nr:hypothetical protein [Paraflavitalea speifideiaquila]
MRQVSPLLILLIALLVNQQVKAQKPGYGSISFDSLKGKLPCQ